MVSIIFFIYKHGEIILNPIPIQNMLYIYDSYKNSIIMMFMKNEMNYGE